VLSECLLHQLHFLPPELEEEEGPSFSILSIFRCDNEPALASSCRLEFLDKDLRGRRMAQVEIQDMLLCRIIGEGIFGRLIFPILLWDSGNLGRRRCLFFS
jgi:hypothetical protein